LWGEESSINHQSVKLEMHIIIDFKHRPQEVLIEVIRGVKYGKVGYKIGFGCEAYFASV
jgi:hypothetical protein